MNKYATFHQTFNLLPEGQSLSKTAGFWDMAGNFLVNTALPKLETWAAKGAGKAAWETSKTVRGSLAAGMKSKGFQTLTNTMKTGFGEAATAAQRAEAVGATKEFASKAGKAISGWASPLHNANLKDTTKFTATTEGPAHRPWFGIKSKNSAFKVNNFEESGIIKTELGNMAKGITDIFGKNPDGTRSIMKNMWKGMVNNWNSSGYYMNNGYVHKGSLVRQLGKPLTTTAGMLGTSALAGGLDAKEVGTVAAMHIGGPIGMATMAF